MDAAIRVTRRNRLRINGTISKKIYKVVRSMCGLPAILSRPKLPAILSREITSDFVSLTMPFIIETLCL